MDDRITEIREALAEWSDVTNRFRSLSAEQQKLYPINARLQAWRLHCEAEHGASPDDYRLNVLGWHGREHPTCDWKPGVF